MSTRTKAVLALLALGTSAWVITAQDTGDTNPNSGRPRRHGPPGAPPDSAALQGPGGFRPHRRPPPIIAALDVNKDGVIDETEIANAVVELKTLDKNGDGKLTLDELMPPPPPWHDGPPPDGPQEPGADEPPGQPNN